MLRREIHHGRAFQTLETIYTRLEQIYQKLLVWALLHRGAVVGIAVFAVALGGIIASGVPSEFSIDRIKTRSVDR